MSELRGLEADDDDEPLMMKTYSPLDRSRIQLHRQIGRPDPSPETSAVLNKYLAATGDSKAAFSGTYGPGGGRRAAQRSGQRPTKT
ncbi:hypothetical protein J6590_013287 [Homalodisca vitripennis]|nr:hypothetical protein J6590_013287 [Homalodisca vitripennis]